jgi:hypothetical protein
VPRTRSSGDEETTAIATSPPQETPGPESTSRRQHRIRRHWREAVVVFFAWLASALVFFRLSWTSGFNKITGNLGDTRLAIYLEEHWFLVFRGHSSWLNPEFFYPLKGVLGWTDTFFLYELFYAPLHLLGADQFLAFELTLITASFVGFAGFVLLARLVFNPPLGIALAGAWIFTVANNLSVHASSAQLFGIYFLPGIACVAVIAWRDMAIRTVRSSVLFAIFGLLYATFLFSFFYVAWLSLLAGGVLFLVTFLLSPRSMASDIAQKLRKGWLPLCAGLCAFGLGIIPFLRTYVPVIHEFGGRQYSTVLYYAPTLRELLPVPGSLLWGHVLSNVSATYESDYTITPLLFVTVVLAGPFVLRKCSPGSSGVEQRKRRTTFALCITTLVLTALPVKTSLGSLWIVVWHLPGATAIRASDRLEVVTNLIAAMAFVVIGTSVSRYWKRDRNRTRSNLVPALILIVAIVLCFEQLDTGPAANISRTQQLALLRAVPDPPKTCTTFFLTDSVHTTEPFYVYQIDAMFISQKVGIPTFNGYSGEIAPNWGLLFPERSSYRFYALHWTEQNHIRTGICELDIGHMTWSGFDPAEYDGRPST